MSDEREPGKNRPCESVSGGFTVFMEAERIRAFMEARDFSSASELGHFSGIGSHIENKAREKGGASILALSMGETCLERDFASLEIAHALARNGMKVLIVDCDFLHPGLSGLVEDLEEHGFLDLLLYGSSLRTVAKSVGIDGVSIAGPGSFPVSRTIPFALKEFIKIRDFLRSKHDVIIFCSTLETEDGKQNPLVTLVDGVIAVCRIDKMAEGELEKRMASLSAQKPPMVEVLCFCGAREGAKAEMKAEEATEEVSVAGAGREKSEEKRKDVIALPMEGEAGEKIVEPEKKPSRKIDFQRVGIYAAAAVIVAFVAWWVAVHRTVEKTVSPGKPLVVGEEKRGAGDGSGVAPAAGDTQTVEGGEIGTPGEQTAAATEETVSKSEAEVESGEKGAEPIPKEEVRSLPAGPPKYTIHVASFTEDFRAQAEKEFLEKNGFEVRIVEVPIKGKTWLRVFAGSYATADQAEKARLGILGLKGHAYARVVEIEKMAK